MSVIQRGKAVWARFQRTQLWRAWKRYGDRRGNRLAGATSFFGFLSLFPLIVLAAAITGPLLGHDAIEALKDALQQNLPGIGDKIDIDSLIGHAGAIGLVSGASLLLTGLGWIDSLRASIRSMHELDDEPGNAIKLKGVDLGALIGLGLIGLIATGASSILTGLSKRIADWTNLDGTWLAHWGLGLISLVIGVAAGAVLFLYMQTALPRILLPRKVSLIAALAGGILFYLAQRLGNLYVNHVLGANAAYGAVALPLALLVWIYLMTRVIMLVAAWTKEATVDAKAAEPAEPAERSELPSGPAEIEPLLLGPPGKRYKVVPIPERKADTVAVAAGAVLGATLTTLAVQGIRAVRSIRRQ
ncbi:membrane protein [Kribbella sp. VKM Ac-2569]|uniref:YihY/virulence factor BrkB family protein n=1 Tax=Kribbella sp. VKM Ac-2569 TaxID=2512220 RepID=UPI00102AC64E|nr:YihY/virulence factor BrkB family protein [Kribbella sp. VKM Ac-2569]RZT28333.1 membrane protein [Kribbella sp. VKM Ac-2569]